MNSPNNEFYIPGISLLKTGKVRSLFELDNQSYLIVTSDRISAFDVVLPTPIPEKGIILTQISNFWFNFFSSKIKNHLIHSEFKNFPQYLQNFKNQLSGRSIIVRKLKMLPFEFIVRGYITGSLWKQYRAGGIFPEFNLPPNLKESQKLPSPIFTPTTKAESGHDISITKQDLMNAIGKELSGKVESLSLDLYNEASNYAQSRGIIIADTKFEFGLSNGELVIADEVLSPDSSRFWPSESYKPGYPQQSFDKQFVRDYLGTLNWDKTPPGPELPSEVVKATKHKYEESFRRITGEVFKAERY
ncbi:phosphoribosylaminoimidazolesuccinocarboxamide synthase [bacterium]|nr:phosphoribosylaminoimidazolesuccinocarboxamide synthase [candidate division CSSED10-310 bacterium]